MGDGDAGACRCGDAARHARNHFHIDSMLPEGLGFFASTTEDEGVAAFQAHDHTFARFGGVAFC